MNFEKWKLVREYTLHGLLFIEQSANRHGIQTRVLSLQKTKQQTNQNRKKQEKRNKQTNKQKNKKQSKTKIETNFLDVSTYTDSRYFGQRWLFWHTFPLETDSLHVQSGHSQARKLGIKRVDKGVKR